jgi:hypothetical protein
MGIKIVPSKLGEVHPKERAGMEFRKLSVPIHGNKLINAYIYKI